jgi:hypothetical protein
MTPTNAELIFWAVAAVIAVLFICALPFISNYLDNKDVERMFSNRKYTEYHDDMEDWK